MHAQLLSATTIGVDAHPVYVEVDVSPGLANFYIVGLPDTAIKESSKRVLTALQNSGIRLPTKKITVNLAPADIRKEGTLFDLPIAITILLATRHIDIDSRQLRNTLFLGELSLDGSIRPIRGALAIACDAANLGVTRMILPHENVHEAACITHLELIGVQHLTQLIAFLKGEHTIAPAQATPQSHRTSSCPVYLDEIKGQHSAKRALEIVAAGKHNIVMSGPPGSGKTMLAKALPHLMQPMTFDEALQTSKIYSISGKLQQSLIFQRPLRTPHHTISQPGLIGGGSFPQPGEISFAHNGILFLDELTEFKRHTLEALRQPLESKSVCIARAHQTVTFPASFILVAALNPCPCGFFGDAQKRCTCSPHTITRYIQKLSGPLMDRIDLHVSVKPVDYTTATAQTTTSSTEQHQAACARIEKALHAQQERFQSINHYNAHMSPGQIEQFCHLHESTHALVKKAFDVLQLSMRGYHKLLKVARTIADLSGSDTIETAHIQEALMYRSFDRVT